MDNTSNYSSSSVTIAREKLESCINQIQNWRNSEPSGSSSYEHLNQLHGILSQWLSNSSSSSSVNYSSESYNKSST